MKLEQVQVVYFSAAGSTRRIAQAVAAGTGLPVQEWDATAQRAQAPFQPTANTLTIVAAPNFEGVAPEPFLQKLSQMQGAGMAAVVTTYGVQGLDSVLLQLQHKAQEQGYRVVGAGAFVARHSLAPGIASGRPNAEDLTQAQGFGAQLVELIDQMQPEQEYTLTLPGKCPYPKTERAGAWIKTSKACVECGRCADACPTGSIPAEKPCKTNHKTCIACMQCVYVCPAHARHLGRIRQWGIEQILCKKCKPQHPNTIWLAAPQTNEQESD